MIEKRKDIKHAIKLLLIDALLVIAILDMTGHHSLRIACLNGSNIHLT